MKRYIVAAAVCLSSISFASSSGDWDTNPGDMDEFFETFTPEEIYQELLDWEAETGLKVEQNLRICVAGNCELFNHFDNTFMASEIRLESKKKKPGSKSGVESVLRAVGKGISGGGTVKIDHLKVNVDGSFEIKGLEISAGLGVGADAPMPGKDEDGKQTHHH